MQKYAKAIAAAIVAGLGTTATALADSAISTQEYFSIAAVIAAALGVVFAVPNKPS